MFPLANTELKLGCRFVPCSFLKLAKKASPYICGEFVLK